jgi:hypothetical protein
MLGIQEVLTAGLDVRVFHFENTNRTRAAADVAATAAAVLGTECFLPEGKFC